MKKLEGIIIPCVTPFDEHGLWRRDWTKKNFEKWNKTKVSGYMILGSNGEFRSLNDDEAFEIIYTVSKLIPSDKTLIAGVGRESLYHTLRFIERLKNANVEIDYISVLTPCYFKKLMTDKAIIDYYWEIADSSPYPVLLYCAPGFANEIRISPASLKILAGHPNIAGIKDTSPDMMDAYMDAVGARNDFQVFAGSLGNIFSCMEHGGTGGIISAANYFPDTCTEFIEIYQKKGRDESRLYLEELKRIAKGTGAKAGVAGVKAVMNIMGYAAGIPRRPVMSCDDQFIQETEAFIKKNSSFIIEGAGKNENCNWL